jgi:sarcosine oxidase subunit gamma
MSARMDETLTTLTGDTVLRVLPPRAMVRLQLPRRAIAAAASLRIGDTPLPTIPGHSAGVDPAVLWLAPDGWLLISASGDGAALVDAGRRACAGQTAAVVDVSDSLVAFELAGSRVRELLARGTGLELTEAMLSPGRCTRTRFAQLAVILRPQGEERVELIVDRGPAAWLREWFIDAGGLL